MNNIQIKGMLYKKACLSSSKIIAAKAENVKRGKRFRYYKYTRSRRKGV
jgi:hypothetical protein